MDELMFFTLFLCGDLLRRKKEGKRLTFREKWLFLQLVASICNTVAIHQKYAADNEYKARILAARVESFAEQEINPYCIEQGRDSIPHTVDVHDVPALESLDEEEHDTEISEETARQILVLAAACKEFKLGVSKKLDETEHADGQETHS
jgi:hypothetical protein